ncbi:hypothetical protein TRFO_19034 [Tritrichomonas foetus]|uniref:Ras-GEF domain-containing protein n=1 Tax=Tritrichomonas foetus TaxID=1144522 RepID=A0A1J4KJJ5_9EUKA|nr:hypothetical protein TRFO_19034 [Tritrichomonas foetus]|eukprot:OHT11495.1 hypothetical protein TRFO_19034 [Tritrichomonas foetus]
MNSSLADLNRRYEELCQEANQAYNTVRAQMEANRPLEMQKMQVEAQVLQLKNYVENHPKQDEVENELGKEVAKLQDISNKAIQSEKKLNNRVVNPTPAPAFYDSTNIKDIKEIAHGVRQLYSRKQTLLKSIDYLQKERDQLIDERDDLQTQLQEDRKWANEKEEQLAKATQKKREKHNHKTKTIHDDEMKYHEELKKLETEKNVNQVHLSDLNLWTNQYEQQIDSLRMKINHEKDKDDDVELIDKLLNAIDNLHKRSKQYSDIIESTVQLNLAKEEVEALQSQLESISSKYNKKRERVIKLASIKLQKKEQQRIGVEQVLHDSIKDLQKLEEDREQYKKEKQLYLDEIDKLKKEERESLKIFKELQSSLDMNLINDYDSVISNIKVAESSVAQQDQSISLNIKMINCFKEDNNKLNEILRQLSNIYSSSNESEEQKNLIGQFQKIVTKEKNNVKELKKRVDQSLIENKTQVEEINTKLSKTISHINHRINPEKTLEMNSDQNNRGRENYHHGPITLADYNKENIKYDIANGSNGEEVSVNLATLNAMVELLFHPDVIKSQYDRQMILAWHNTLTPMAQLALDIRDKINNQKKGTPIIPNAKNNSVFLDAMEFFRIWLNDFSKDFYDEEIRKSVIEMLKSFEGLSSDEDETAKEEIEISINKIKSFENKESKKSDFPATFISIVNTKDNLRANLMFSPMMADPQILAYHFMYIDLNIYSKIERYEFIKCAWSKPDRDVKAAHITELTKNFNKTAVIVMETILREKKLKQRKMVLESWIKIMEEAEKINNFNLIFEIDAAMTNPAIIRLKQTWDKVNPDLRNSYNQLSDITAPFRKFGKYKTKLDGIPCVKALPYLGPWLTEMTFIEDGNPKTKALESGEDAINFQKQKAYYIPVSYLTKPWGKEISFQIDEKIKESILNFNIMYKDDTAIFAESRLCEKDVA